MGNDSFVIIPILLVIAFATYLFFRPVEQGMCWYNRKKRQHTRPKPTVTAAEVSPDLSLSHELDESGSAAVLGVEDHKGEPIGDNFDHQKPNRVISPSAVDSDSDVHVTREPAEPAPSVPTTGEHEPKVLLGDEVEHKANDTYSLVPTVSDHPATVVESAEESQRPHHETYTPSDLVHDPSVSPLDAKAHTSYTPSPVHDGGALDPVSIAAPTSNLGVESKEDVSTKTPDTDIKANTEVQGFATPSVSEQQNPGSNFAASAVALPTVTPLTPLTPLTPVTSPQQIIRK
jgi:hypothetical protein